MGLNLGQDWEFQPDAPNNRLYAEYGPSGSQFSFDESGDLTLDSGSLDLSGGSLTDSSQDYVDLTGNDVRVGIGQSIEDGSGNERISFDDSTTTRFRDGSGDNRVQVTTDSWTTLALNTDNSKFRILDNYGGFTALRYDTNATTGTLELTNANLDAGGNDIVNAGSVNAVDTETQTLTLTEQAGLSREHFYSEEYYFDDGLGSITTTDQFRVRFSATFPFRMLLLDISIVAGETGASRHIQNTMVTAQVRRDSFNDFTTDTRVSALPTNGDLSITHVGSDKEFDVTFENTGTGDQNEWAVKIETLLGGGDLMLKSASVEPS